MTTVRSVLTGIAAASVALAPVAAQAGTRAASSPVAVDVQRGSGAIAGESELKGGSLIWLLLLVAAIAVALAAGGGGGDGGRSRG